MDLWGSFVNLFSQIILYFSHLLGNNYAAGIILFTLVVRLILMPLMQYQMVTSRKTTELQPEIKRLREKYSGRDRQSQMELQEAISKLNKENGVNQWAGCLPVLLQFPILIALYQGIYNTQELYTGRFFWTELGTPDPYYILPILAAFFTWLNSYLTLQGQTKEMQQMKFMQLYFLPGMIFVFGLTVNSALALYWVVGNMFTVAQTLLLNNPYKIRAQRQEKKRAERAKARALKRAQENAWKKNKK